MTTVLLHGSAPCPGPPPAAPLLESAYGSIGPHKMASPEGALVRGQFGDSWGTVGGQLGGSLGTVGGQFGDSCGTVGGQLGDS